MIEYWANNCEAYLANLPFNPKKKTHTQNQWRKSGQLRKPHQCAAKCGTQYESENHAMLQHMDNCNHNAVLMSSAKLTRTSQ